MNHKYVLEKLTTGMYAILIDDKVANKIITADNKRAICSINNEIDIHCAILNKKDGQKYITIGAEVCKKLHLKVGSTLQASFKIDDTAYQFEMPEELAEVLGTDKEAHTIFHALTAGNQRGLIYLVSMIKSTDKKIERSLKIAEQIKRGVTSARLVLK
jgi:hypothetical protein